MKQEIQITKSPITIGTFQGSRALMFNTLTEIHSFATMVCKTDLVPKAYKGKSEDATIAIIFGMEIGLPPMASLQNIALVNGSPSVYGDAQLSLVQASGKYEWHKSSYKGTFPNDDFTAIFEVKRVGATESVVKEYSIADAKRAGLWGKAGTWTTNPKLMLLYKPKSYALREAFADTLKGMKSNEELEGEEMVEVSQKPSKTSNAHTPPAAIMEGFIRPSPSFKEEVEQPTATLEESVQTDIEDFIGAQEETVEEKAKNEEAERISANIEAKIKNAFNLNGLAAALRYVDVQNGLKWLETHKPSYFAEIKILEQKKREELKAKGE